MYLIGNGTSTFSSQAAAYTARMLASPARRPAGPGLAGGRFRYFTPALSDQDVVVGITASGEFRDVLAVFERLEGKCLRVGITRPGIVRHTSVRRAAVQRRGEPCPGDDQNLCQHAPRPHLLLLEFFRAPQDWYEDLRRTADHTEEALRGAEGRAAELVEAFKGYEHAFTSALALPMPPAWRGP